MNNIYLNTSEARGVARPGGLGKVYISRTEVNLSGKNIHVPIYFYSNVGLAELFYSWSGGPEASLGAMVRQTGLLAGVPPGACQPSSLTIKH